MRAARDLARPRPTPALGLGRSRAISPPRWEDVELAAEGRAEALRAGALLAQQGVQFDVVYTSWLSRAIETAWLVRADAARARAPERLGPARLAPLS